MGDEQAPNSPIQFPCDFMLKIMGKANSHFEETAINIVLRHYPNTDLTKMVKRASKDNNYLALTLTISAQNKAELDALYQDLSAAPEILMTL